MSSHVCPIIAFDIRLSGPCVHCVHLCSRVSYGYASGDDNTFCASRMATDATLCCSLNCTRSLHENGRTATSPVQRPIHRYGGISFPDDYAGTDNVPTPTRTQLMRTSTPVKPVELDRGEAPSRYTDRCGFVPPGSADPDRAKHFMVASSDLRRRVRRSGQVRRHTEG